MNVRFPTDHLAYGYEAPVKAFLKARKCGKLAGHGALINEDGTEVLEADFSVDLTDSSDEIIGAIVEILEEAGAPLGCAWSFDDTPDEKTPFGTLDGLLVRFEGLSMEELEPYRDVFGTIIEIIEAFHAEYADVAGFQGVTFSRQKVVACFHGFEFDDMAQGLRDAIAQSGTSYSYEIERTTEPT